MPGRNEYEVTRDSAAPTRAPRDLLAIEYYNGFRIMIESIGDYHLNAFTETCFKAAESGKKAVTIVIHSRGGQCDVAWAMHEEIRILSSQICINAVVVGHCYSAALYPFLAVPREQRFASANSRFMIHSCATSDQYGKPKENPTEEELASTRDYNDRLLNLMDRETDVDRVSLAQLLNSGFSHDFGFDHALGLGIVGGSVG